MADAASETSLAWVPSPRTDTFGDRLRLLRYDLGLTVEEIAKLCDLMPKSWWNWENGSLPRDLADVVNKIFSATSCNRLWLMWGTTTAGKAHLVGLPSALDARYRNTYDRPLLSMVPDDDKK